MPRVRTRNGPVQVNNQILRTASVSTAITFLNRGLERHPGESPAHPRRQLDRVRAAVLRAEPATRQYPKFQFVAVYSQGSGNTFCGQTVEDGLNQLLGLTHRASCISNAPTGDTG